ncbi:MAG TPA: hypothetical protein VL832_02750 [Puia sp.]|jgi:hypothetical protein|nr:hypothetical protein [Puia sp.]
MLNKSPHPPLPEIFIGKETISRRIRNYLQNKHALLSEGLSKKDDARQETKSIWYSKEHLRTWLAEMDLMDADGMRVYLGAYGDDEGPASGQICLLMVLTRAFMDGNFHKDIILEDEPEFEVRKQSLEAKRAGNEIFTDMPILREYNYGSPCPPICPPPGTGFGQE